MEGILSLSPHGSGAEDSMTHFQSRVAVTGAASSGQPAHTFGLKHFRTGLLHICILFSLACKPG